jgi:hemoglobin
MFDTLSPDAIAVQITTFYGRARTDDLLGPVFATITDWPPHIERITAFWTRTLLGTGRYDGNPLAEHRKHPLTPEMFELAAALGRDGGCVVRARARAGLEGPRRSHR